MGSETVAPPIRWAILTGEYPPQTGGVADYTAQVARGLAAAGDTVIVYAPPHSHGKEIEAAGVSVVRLRDHFGPRGLRELDTALARARPDRLLVQYVPQAFGWKGMNLAFALWVAVRASRLARVWVMFHEVAFPVRWRPVTHAVIGGVTRVMARLVAGVADRVFVSTAAWGPFLRRLCPRVKPAEWLPIPSNIPIEPPAAEVVRLTSGIAVGHFGTYGPPITNLLEPLFVRLLRQADDRTAVLLGRGGEAFRERFVGHHPELAARVVAAGELPPVELTARLRGCDLLVQPFLDGISSRRTSAMAGLANGIPVVSNLGELSEPLWAELGWPSIARGPDPDALASAVEAVLALTPAERAELGRQAAALYRNSFALERTISRLRTLSPTGAA